MSVELAFRRHDHILGMSPSALLVTVNCDRHLEHNWERENPRLLDLHIKFALVLPCFEALIRTEHETIVDVSRDNPNGKLATPAETPNTNWFIHLSMCKL